MSTSATSTDRKGFHAGFEFIPTQRASHLRTTRTVILKRSITSASRPQNYISEIITTRSQPARFVRHYRDAAPQVIEQPLRSSAAVSKRKLLKKPKQKHVANLAIAIAFVMSGWLGFSVYNLHHATAAIESKQDAVLGASDTANDPPDSNAVVTPSTVSEHKPTGNYRVDPGAPKRLIIKKLAVDAPVIGVGNNKKGEMATPTNIWTAGWYKQSASPKDNGTTVINGHVYGPTQPGIFNGLKKLVAGDIIKVVTGDNTSYSYKVVRTQSFKAGEMGAELYNSVSDKPGLNLVTCSGSLDKKTDSYNQRLVVYAERI